MRCPIFFNAVSQIVPISDKTTLPPNIVVAQGRHLRERRENAYRALKNNRHINAVVVFDVDECDQSAALVNALHSIHAAIPVRRLKTAFYHQASG